ncbi:polysaccharide deacetylase family protein [Brevundimonas sp.]|uniref:polysaccharide deacetylase family protein n=1 Tax=Brevundimonas sp. TaxID=1871086 RepID=UPI001AC5B827|nr:polysaccharide deacetylase family protein [Brevundimonas sp.]MBN9465592.1 polysaccharide deacetylase family protein [Brevundimonas sp.]
MNWRGILCITSFVLSAPLTASAWPNGRKAAIVLTYDDALPSQIETALPALDARGLKGVFFLSDIRAEDIPAWRAAAQAGHELGNHTPFHPCLSTTFKADPRYTLEAYSPASLLREIRLQNTLLTAIDGRTSHGFATPCGQTTAGGEDYIEPLRASGLVTYSRGVSASSADLSKAVADLDPMNVPARGFSSTDSDGDMIDFAEQAMAGGGLAVFLFHGVGGDHLAVSSKDHAAFLDWLNNHQREVWVTTLGEALAWRDPAAHP